MRDSRLLLIFGAVCACFVAGAYSRELLVNSQCPAGCMSGKCIQDKTTGTYRCTKCVGNLVVLKATGTCGCRPGRTWEESAGTADLFGNQYQCTLCAKGSYCAGGSETDAAEVGCPQGMDTINRGAKSKWQCVELPGFEYKVVGNTPGVEECPANTYNPGYQKKKCAACPAGFETAFVGSVSADDCQVPLGFFLRAPGEIAPCPQGEYKDTYGPARKCSPCPEGITTSGSASKYPDGCKYLLPGYYATDMAGPLTSATAAICPQKFWCPGATEVTDFIIGDPVGENGGAGLLMCPYSLWTRGEGSISDKECMVPPGHYFATTSTPECPNGQYREEWARPSEATSCTACATGDPAGYTSEPSLMIDEFSYSSGKILGQLQVKGAPGSCVLLPGYGMYKKGSGFSVVACAKDNYGASANIYGLGVVPCRPCPSSMETKPLAQADSSVKNTDGTGFIAPEACLTRPGFGYDGIVSTQCPADFYNVGFNRLQCQQCPWGTTTTEVSTAQTAVGDCKAAPGYYKDVTDNNIFECARGTYQDLLDQTSCKPCTGNRWTASTASDSADDCDAMCAAGFGGASTSACVECASSNSYGPLERDGTECMACPAETTFRHNQDPGETFISGPVSRIPATNKGDCVSAYAQIEAGLWYLAAQNTIDGGVSTMATCASTCTGDCMFFTFNYEAQDCFHKMVVSGDDHRIAFKAVPAGLVAGANSLSDAKTIASGLYTFWPTSSSGADGIGRSQFPVSGVTSVADCLAACDNDALCAGVFMDASTDDDSSISVCKTIEGESMPGPEVNVKRSMTRVVQHQLK